MALSDKHRRLAGFATAAAVAGLVLGAAFSVPAGRTPGGESVEWALPAAALAPAQRPEDVEAVSASPLWRGPQAQADAEAARVTWRLAGVVGGERPVALVAAGNEQRILRLSAGEELPDGSRLEEVGRDSVSIRDAQGCHVRVQLYQGPGVRPESSCDTPTPVSEPPPGSR